MVRKHRFSLLVATVCSAAAVLLAGCGAAGSFPSVDPGTSPIGEIHGLNMGGHAPLAGSHIYLLEAGNSGYGSLVKSLITSTANGATANGSWKNSGYGSDLFVPSVDASGNTIYGLTTDSLGGFTLTGDYTCDVGRVVYLVGVGGNPGLSGTAVTVTSAQVTSLSGSGTSETASVTLTFSSSPSYSSGSNLSFSGFSGTFQSGTGINGTTSVVTGGSGATATVSIPDPSGAVGVGTYSVSGTATPSYFNHAAVNMAILGQCPSSGTFAGVIPYIYMNEVSTVAAAYVLQPYLAASGTNQTGIDEFHIGSSSTTLGLQGIQNAALTAANLYDVTGTNSQTSGTHAALATTPAGNGTVPQATLDTLANVLAACIDSGNNYRAGLGTQQASCQSLFQYASDNGVYDTSTYNGPGYSWSHVAFSTVQAALNIARYPGATSTGTTSSSGTQTVTGSSSGFVSAIYNLETGTVPFTPNLHSSGAGAPTYWIAAATYNVGVNTNALAIDASGNIWMAAYEAPNVEEMANNGSNDHLILSDSTNTAEGFASLAIDASGNVWAGEYGSNAAASCLWQLSASGTEQIKECDTTNTANGFYALALDGTGNLWAGEGGTPSVSDCLYEDTSTGVESPGKLDCDSTNTVQAFVGIAIDASGHAWVGEYGGAGSGDCFYEFLGNGSTGGSKLGCDTTNTIVSFESVAVGPSGNIWTVEQGGGGCLWEYSGGSLSKLYCVSSGFGGIAIDSAGTIWAGEMGATDILKFSSSNALSMTIPLPSGAYFGPRLGIAVDGSGNLWETSQSGSLITEYIGIAAPVVTPLVANFKSPYGTPSSKP